MNEEVVKLLEDERSRREARRDASFDQLRAKIRQRRELISSLPDPKECERLRVEAQLSREELGEAAGCSPSVIALMEHGKFSVRVRQTGILERYARAISVIQEELG